MSGYRLLWNGLLYLCPLKWILFVCTSFLFSFFFFFPSWEEHEGDLVAPQSRCTHGKGRVSWIAAPLPGLLFCGLKHKHWPLEQGGEPRNVPSVQIACRVALELGGTAANDWARLCSWVVESFKLHPPEEEMEPCSQLFPGRVLGYRVTDVTFSFVLCPTWLRRYLSIYHRKQETEQKGELVSLLQALSLRQL